MKRCLDVDDKFLQIASDQLIDETLNAIMSDVWLNKIRYDANGERILVTCARVYIKSQVLVSCNVNLSACTLEELPDAFVSGMTSLCELHGITGVGGTGEYLDPSVDHKVGLGVLGLANFLAQKITYAEFSKLLPILIGVLQKIPWPTGASQLALGIQLAAMEAKRHNMVRAFAIAPTASCSYNSIDLRGYTTTPEIAPPTPIHRSNSEPSVHKALTIRPTARLQVGLDTRCTRKSPMTSWSPTWATGLFHGYGFNS